jgi:hypothetical protein
VTDHRATAIVVAGAACEIRIGDEKIRDSFSGEDQADSMAYALGLLAASRHPRYAALWHDDRRLKVRIGSRHTLGLAGTGLEIQAAQLIEHDPTVESIRAFCGLDWRDGIRLSTSYIARDLDR